MTWLIPMFSRCQRGRAKGLLGYVSLQSSQNRSVTKNTEFTRGEKKDSKNVMHSTEWLCHTWLWKIIQDAYSAKMKL